MAIVRELEKLSDLVDARHTDARCTYAIINDEDGRRWLQVDTYGSSSRRLKGKKSQSIRFAPEAVAQLRKIIESEMR